MSGRSGRSSSRNELEGGPVERHTEPVRGYGQHCPVARGAEIFATRWTPIIVRNLLLGCRTFSELAAGAPGIPRALLSERLRQLEERGIVERHPNPRGRGWLYEPTAACEDLRPVCDALAAWGATWVEIAPEHLDPYAALWGMCRGIGYLPLPERRVTVRFELRNTRRAPRRLWLLVHRPEPELCVKPPGFEEDLVVTTDPQWLIRWVLGQASLGQGMNARLVEVDGPRHLVRTLNTWGEQGVRAMQTWGRERAARPARS
jgi:DNA-binding HxlR family transcriptional regulator